MTRQELIETLEQRLKIRGIALANLKMRLGDTYDRDRAIHVYRALEDTIRVLRGEAATNCTMPQILHHADLMIFRAKSCGCGECATLFLDVREQLKAFYHLSNSIAA